MFIKKGAMFGLESRALKKQFGKLFLVRMQREAPKGANGARIQSNRGAMFGLDARIALSIFGALSVISGAALYSAIQQAKVVAAVTEMKELSKAVEAFMLDTGVDLSVSQGSYILGDLMDNTKNFSGWNGPYFSTGGTLIGGSDNRFHLDHPMYGNLLIANVKSNIGGATGYIPLCTDSPCYYWIQLNGLEPSFAKAIDEYVDGSSTRDSGNVRIIDTDLENVFFKGPLLLKQP